jgi:restriction endonuclease S subunit
MNIRQAQLPKGDALSLPKGWEIKKLGEVVDIIKGRNQSQVILERGEYPIYGSAGNLLRYAADMKENIKISPKGCNDDSPMNNNGQKSQRDGIVISPLRGLGTFFSLIFYNHFIPSGFKCN